MKLISLLTEVEEARYWDNVLVIEKIEIIEKKINAKYIAVFLAQI